VVDAPETHAATFRGTDEQLVNALRETGSRLSGVKAAICAAAADRLHSFITTAKPQLFGPYAHLNGPRALPEDSWEVEDDPIENREEYFSIPLFAQVDVTFPVTHGAPDAEAYRAYADELREDATDPKDVDHD